MEERPSESLGRWPAHTIVSHNEDCVQVGTRAVKSGKAHRSNSGGKNFHSDAEKPAMEDMTYAVENGNEQVEAWECSEGCAVAMLDQQSGISKAKPGRSGKRGGSACFGSPTLGSPEKEGV